MKQRNLLNRTSDFLLSLVLCSCFFYFLTGGAFLQSREWANTLSFHPNLHTAFQISMIGLVALVSAIRYRINPKTFFDIEPFRFFQKFSALPPKAIILILFLAYFATQFMTLSFMHAGLRTALWDVGFYDQMLWNTAHGRWLTVSVRGGLNLLGHHFEPIFLLLSPIYWFQDSIYPVFGLIALSGASVIVLVYLIAQEILKSKNEALLFALAAFFYQPLRNATLFAIQSQVFADSFLLLGFLCLLKKKNWLGFIFFVIAILCKESILLDVLGIGLFVIYQDRKKITGWLIAALSILSYLIIFKIVEPHYLWQHDPWQKWGFFSHLSHPTAEHWKQLLDPNPFWFLFLILGPVMFLPFFCGGWFLLLGSSLAIRLLSNYGGLRLITAHYTAGLNALILIASIYGYARLRSKTKNRSQILPLGFLIAFLLFSGIPQLIQVENYLWDMSFTENQKIVSFFKAIPKSYSVKATDVFLAQLTHRQYIFSFTSVLPGSPYEKINQNPDLLVVDEIRLQGVEQTVLSGHLSQGYKPIIRGTYISVYANPGLDPALISQLQARWEELQKEKEVSYRKIVRRWYKLFLIIAAISLIFILIRRHLL